MIDGERRLTYPSWATGSRGSAARSDDLGVAPGGFVGVLGANTRAHLECWLAVPASGRVLNRPQPPARALRAGVHGRRLARPEVADRRRRAARDRARAEGPLRVARHVVHAGDAVRGGPLAFEALLRRRRAGARRAGDALAAISYTGGTTGRPKGVMLSHGNLVANAKHFLISDAAHGRRTATLHAAPMFHVADSTMVFCAHVGRRARTSSSPRFDPPGSCDAIERHGVTAHRARADDDRGCCSTTSTSTPPTSPACGSCTTRPRRSPGACSQRAMSTLRCDFLQCYGMTEAAPGVTYLAAGGPPPAAALRSSGTPIPGVQVEIRDPPAGRARRRDRRGVRPGPNIMLGYWNRPEATAEALSADGWYRTGDAAHVTTTATCPRRSPQGHDHQRRRERVLDRGRERHRLPPGGAARSPSSRVPDERWGERVHAVVVLEPGARPDEAAIVEHCRGGSPASSSRARSSCATSRCRSRARARSSRRAAGAALGGRGPPRRLSRVPTLLTIGYERLLPARAGGGARARRDPEAARRPLPPAVAPAGDVQDATRRDARRPRDRLRAPQGARHAARHPLAIQAPGATTRRARPSSSTSRRPPPTSWTRWRRARRAAPRRR